MEKETTSNFKVGLVVITGTILLVIALYSIGKKQNLFGSTFRIQADFTMVNGLTEGNNVRFAGIDVGTVEKVEIISDTMVRVTMLIEDEIQQHVRKNSVASIGTDGLMGNKLVNIHSPGGSSEVVSEGDRIMSADAFKTEKILETLNTTNENLQVITSDIRMIAQKINGPNALWSILLDTTVADNFKEAVLSIRTTSANTAALSADLAQMVNDVKNGQGAAGALLTDTVLSLQLTRAIADMKHVTSMMAKVSDDLSNVVSRANNGEGALGTILADSVFASNLSHSMQNIKEGTANFNENMEALKKSFLLRKYFRKKNKVNQVNQ